MKDLRSGRLFMELSALERTQGDFLLSGFSVTELGNVAVKVYNEWVPCSREASRSDIESLLIRAGYTVRPAWMQELPPLNLEPKIHDFWVELLQDLGSYETEMKDISPGLSYQRIEIFDLTVKISLSNGERTKIMQVRLDRGEFPAALPVDFAFEFNK